MASVIQSITQIEITIAIGSTTNTQTVSVTAANAWLIYNGSTTTSASSTPEGLAYLTLTNGTTVTATRNLGTAFAVTVYGTLVEFASDVNAISYGTITITSGTSGTVNPSGGATSANAFVGFLGIDTSIAALAVTDF